MMYYGFMKDTRACQFSADAQVQDMEGMVIIPSDVTYSNIAKLTFDEVDGEYVISTRADTSEELEAMFVTGRQERLQMAGEQIQVLQDVMDYGDSDTAKPLFDKWRKYRADTWALVYDAEVPVVWPTKPE